jgi:precorrin-6B methylase 2
MSKNHLLQAVYNALIRPHLPQKVAVHNGIPARTAGLFDTTDQRTEWEKPLMAAIRSHVKSGHNVVEIAGGLGICTAAAAQHVGNEGTVTTFEADDDRVEKLAETVSLNKLSNRVTIRHAIVGELEIDIESNADVIPISDVPNCDVLILDCEGAETRILDEYVEKPKYVLVETHGFLGSSREEVSELLHSQGYEIIETNALDESKGVYVLTATTDE